VSAVKLGDETMEALLAGGIALHDVSMHMPRHQTKRYETRHRSAIKRIYVHHSGALGAAGIAGAQASARYSVERHGWPGAAYHYWIPAEGLRDELGRLCVLRLQDDATRSYHTGGAANGHGIGVVLQGNTTAAPLTTSHIECLEALLPWLRERHGLASEWLSWHSDSARFGGSGKASCPGQHAVEWLSAYRAGVP
jgi:hypothetical protein